MAVHARGGDHPARSPEHTLGGARWAGAALPHDPNPIQDVPKDLSCSDAHSGVCTGQTVRRPSGRVNFDTRGNDRSQWKEAWRSTTKRQADRLLLPH